MHTYYKFNVYESFAIPLSISKIAIYKLFGNPTLEIQLLHPLPKEVKRKI